MTNTERAYYDHRAQEYDDFYLGTGLFAQRARPGWHEELAKLQAALGSLQFGSVVDVACGTGFLTAGLRGKVTGLDQSKSMLQVARSRMPLANFVRGDGLATPFRSGQFDCLITGHFYGHLDQHARNIFIAEARRLAKSILVVDAAKREEVPAEEHQQRVLNDGSRHVVYKRYFTPECLMSELGGRRIIHSGRWFLAVLT